MLPIWKSAIFEGIGSMMLIWLIGISSLVLASGENIPTGISIGLLYTLATALSMYTLGPLTGGHINPLITLALMLGGSFSLVRGATYVVAQILGSMVGGAFVAAALGRSTARLTSNGGCVMKSDESFGVGQAFALEFMAAMILLILVNGTGIARQQISSHGKRYAPMLFGLSVGLLNFATSGFATSHAYIGSTGYPNVCFGLAAGIMQFDSTHWVFWIPGFLAVIGWGLIARLLAPYESLEGPEGHLGGVGGEYGAQENQRPISDPKVGQIDQKNFNTGSNHV